MLPPLYRLNDLTLVLDWEDTLVYTEWTPQKGLCTIKRPGLDYFLDWAVMNFGEVILFAEKEVMDVSPMIEKLDPVKHDANKQPLPRKFNYYLFKHQLGEDENGKAVKDLGQLNRDLKIGASLYNNPEMFRLHTSNGVQIPSFDGDPKDVALLDLIPHLQGILPASSSPLCLSCLAV